MPDLIYLNEPPLLFNFGQAMLDPRDGLALFGPLDQAKPEGIRWGVIGPSTCIGRMKRWVAAIQRPVASVSPVARPSFPGFEAAFNTKWRSNPVIEISVPERELYANAHCADKHQRVYRTVDMYAKGIKNAIRTEDVSVDIWCVVIPEYVYLNCRPQSIVPAQERVQPAHKMRLSEARDFEHQKSLLEEDNLLAEQYLYEVNFHHQLKARLLGQKVPIQIVREIKIAFREFVGADGKSIYPFENLESAIAWNLSTAVFYKAGGRPWKLGAARPGVCYVGLVFKQLQGERSSETACCAAQMFLDSGDGVVFKGAVGPWYRGKRGLFHLNRRAAKELIAICLEAYAKGNDGRLPEELFVHGRIALDDDEWAGFQEAAGTKTRIIGVRIQPVSFLKLFRKQDHPVLRGIAYLMDSRKGLLWTRGLVPRLRTYPGREVPNPILVDICRGEANLRTVMADIMALTKLNYNACNYADGLPVTLKFANAVGEILTAGPPGAANSPPLQFKYYI